MRQRQIIPVWQYNSLYNFISAVRNSRALCKMCASLKGCSPRQSHVLASLVFKTSKDQSGLKGQEASEEKNRHHHRTCVFYSFKRFKRFVLIDVMTA